MSNFLSVDFCEHNNFDSAPFGISQDLDYEQFEVSDVNRNLVVNPSITNGMAKFKNPNKKELRVLDYDGFLTALPSTFESGKQRCDMIIHTLNDNSYFILSELKDRIPKTKVRKGAIKQLLATLTELILVPNINSLIDSSLNKICCYNNSQPVAPTGINAVSAFNRISSVAPDGIQLSQPAIESFGFIFKEFKGPQTFTLT